MRGKNKKLTSFGKSVVKALADRDMSKRDLAVAIGVSPQYLSYILNGTRSGEKYFTVINTTLGLEEEHQVSKAAESAGRTR